jgi:hypothetical protein
MCKWGDIEISSEDQLDAEINQDFTNWLSRISSPRIESVVEMHTINKIKKVKAKRRAHRKKDSKTDEIQTPNISTLADHKMHDTKVQTPNIAASIIFGRNHTYDKKVMRKNLIVKRFINVMSTNIDVIIKDIDTFVHRVLTSVNSMTKDAITYKFILETIQQVMKAYAHNRGKKITNTDRMMWVTIIESVNIMYADVEGVPNM